MSQHTISVAGALNHGLPSGEIRPSLAVDFSAIDAAPLDEFIRLYDHLYDAVAGSFVLLNGLLGSTEPNLVVGLKVTIDSRPPLPVGLVEPGH